MCLVSTKCFSKCLGCRAQRCLGIKASLEAYLGLFSIFGLPFRVRRFGLTGIGYVAQTQTLWENHIFNLLRLLCLCFFGLCGCTRVGPTSCQSLSVYITCLSWAFACVWMGLTLRFFYSALDRQADSDSEVLPGHMTATMRVLDFTYTSRVWSKVKAFTLCIFKKKPTHVDVCEAATHFRQSSLLLLLFTAQRPAHVCFFHASIVACSIELSLKHNSREYTHLQQTFVLMLS